MLARYYDKFFANALGRSEVFQRHVFFKKFLVAIFF
jgi:hypothetical protein